MPSCWPPVSSTARTWKHGVIIGQYSPVTHGCPYSWTYTRSSCAAMLSITAVACRNGSLTARPARAGSPWRAPARRGRPAGAPAAPAIWQGRPRLRSRRAAWRCPAAAPGPKQRLGDRRDDLRSIGFDGAAVGADRQGGDRCQSRQVALGRGRPRRVGRAGGDLGGRGHDDAGGPDAAVNSSQRTAPLVTGSACGSGSASISPSHRGGCPRCPDRPVPCQLPGRIRYVRPRLSVTSKPDRIFPAGGWPGSTRYGRRCGPGMPSAGCPVARMRSFTPDASGPPRSRSGPCRRAAGAPGPR